MTDHDVSGFDNAVLAPAMASATNLEVATILLGVEIFEVGEKALVYS